MRGSSVPQRQVGRNLRALREAAGITLRAAAKRIDKAEVTVWRMETGQTPMKTPDVEVLCGFYGATPEVMEALVALTRESRAAAWWQSSKVPGVTAVYAGMEQSADHISTYEDSLIPGLFQTADYTAAVIRSHRPELPTEEVERRVAFRLTRQAILTRRLPPFAFSVVLSETAVRTPMGGPDMMATQLAHIVYVSRLPGISVRMIPLGAGPHPGLYSGNFVILRFPATPGGAIHEPTTVFVESFAGSWYHDKPFEVRQYEEAFEGILSAALDEDATRQALADAAKGYKES
ncbi:helix-turn-helix domain-containing protein [Streptomyces sp. NPDC002454]|uniref:helix-turn-helix domain-containing protein n=1 Tax=Streptomyces sp. NPDC002490 TaxID=3154416 RepID=UPI003327774D